MKTDTLLLIAAAAGVGYFIWRQLNASPIHAAALQQPLQKPLLVQPGESIVQAMIRTGYTVPEINLTPG